jgi:signal transduction histidine kinase
MNDNQKTKQQLLEELNVLRARVSMLEHSEKDEREQHILAEALAKTAATLNSTLDLEEVLKRILNQIGRVMPHDTANILLIDEESNGLRIASGPSYDDYGVEATGLRVNLLDTPTLRQMAESMKTIVISDTQGDPRWTEFEDTHSSYVIRSYVGSPICQKGNLTGFISCNSTKPGFYTPIHAEQLGAFANHAAVAIENARLYDLSQQEIAEREQLNKELSAFAHTVAHDIKGPASVILGFAELLIDDAYPMSDNENKEMLSMISQRSFKLASIVDALLLLSSVREADHLMTVPVDMSTIMNEVTARLANHINEQQAEIIMPDSWPLAMGYEPWIEEVWVNYVSNGIKYGGHPPHIELGSTQQSDGMIKFWISDNGAGISPEEQGSLFAPFTRLNNPKITGQGLGLSIVGRIISKLGGQVGLESEVGKGSIFFFTLPAI